MAHLKRAIEQRTKMKGHTNTYARTHTQRTHIPPPSSRTTGGEVSMTCWIARNRAPKKVVGSGAVPPSAASNSA